MNTTQKKQQSVRASYATILVLTCSLTPVKLMASQNCQINTISSTTPTERFLKQKNNTVVDLQTGLMWRLCVEGTKGPKCEQNEALSFSWEEALLYPKKINQDAGVSSFKDWRLPNIRELSSIAELQCENPAINRNVFPNAPASLVWSSSPYSFYPHYSWFLDFSNGSINYGERKLDLYHVRLVRQAK